MRKRKLKVSILTKLIFIGLLAGVAIYSQADYDSKEYGKLTVVITGFKDDKGKCRFALDDSKFVYEREDTVFIGRVLPIIDKQVIVVIDSLKYGEYAIRVFQDQNENEKVDTNFLGIPTERYGYSNDASSWFGPPSWDRAKFVFDQPEMLIEIKVDSFL